MKAARGQIIRVRGYTFPSLYETKKRIVFLTLVLQNGRGILNDEQNTIYEYVQYTKVYFVM